MRYIFGILVALFCGNVFAGEPMPWQMGFQKPSTFIMRDIVLLYDFVMYLMFGVVAVVVGLLVYVCLRFNQKSNPIPATFTHNVAVEVIWTIVPLIVLIIMAVPSFKLLRAMNTVPKSDLTIKVVGYQWYWQYQYPDHGNFKFDSYFIQDKDLKPGQKRLLDVDNRIIIPQGATVRFVITGGDVIHSFAVPSAGIKTDAVPGRVNETWVKIDEIGVYYGQCSELCGANHGFMPIALEVVEQKKFDAWIEESKAKFAVNGLEGNIINMPNRFNVQVTQNFEK